MHAAAAAFLKLLFFCISAASLAARSILHGKCIDLGGILLGLEESPLVAKKTRKMWNARVCFEHH